MSNEVTKSASCQTDVSTRLFGVYDRNGNIKSVYREPYNAFEEATKLNRHLGKD